MVAPGSGFFICHHHYIRDNLKKFGLGIAENIMEETVKELNILSETKMELKTDEEQMMSVVTADRENVEGRTKEINQTIENLNLAVQEKLDENLKAVINRYQFD